MSNIYDLFTIVTQSYPLGLPLHGAGALRRAGVGRGVRRVRKAGARVRGARGR
jgi:hypothetical protein